MVTLAKTQNFNEFELHARAVLSLPIPELKLLRNGASAVILAESESTETPVFQGLEDAMNTIDSEVRLFGKPATRPYRRMGVTLKYGTNDVKELVEQAQEMAAKISVK